MRDVPLGADGIHSPIRTIIDPAAPAPRYTGLTIGCGYADAEADDAEEGSYGMIRGSGGYFGCTKGPDGRAWWFARAGRAAARARLLCRCRPRQRLVARRDRRTYNFLYAASCASRGGLLVKTLTYSESRAHYAETLDAVVDDREEVIVTRAGHEPVVIVALSEYESLKESAYLLRSPENARRLLASIDRLEHGGGTERDLLE
jgi:antitoxin YefM